MKILYEIRLKIVKFLNAAVEMLWGNVGGKYVRDKTGCEMDRCFWAGALVGQKAVEFDWWAWEKFSAILW